MTVATFGPQLDLEIPAATMQFRVEYVDRAAVFPDPDQPRQEPDAELLESIRANGMLQPISVRPHPEKMLSWMIIDGERRWRGAEGILEQVPVIVREDLDDRAQRLQTQLVSNVGKPLTPLEEAQAFAELLGQHDSIASLARALGRPERSVGERLQLLDLGPWLAWIQAGRLPLSHAVKILLPLRGCPDSVHEHAIEKIGKDYRFERNGKDGEPSGISVHDFERVVREAYKPVMYPLTKTKASYERQPAFDTKAHDQECDCGRIQFEIGSAKRACCGNPGWWRKRHRAAQKEKPKPKAQSNGNGHAQVQFWMPEGSRKMKASGWDTPKGFVEVTHGRHWRKHGLDFDPSSVEYAPEDLVLLQSSYGDPSVAVKESAIAAARAKWKDRWTGRRQGLIEALRRHAKEKASAYRVSGPGVAELLAAVVEANAARDLLDVGEAVNVEIPPALAKEEHPSSTAAEKWIGGLEEKEAAAVATTYAYLLGTRTQAPTERAIKEREAAFEAIAKKPIPWTKAPKQDKPAAKTKTKTKKGKAPPPDESIEDEDDDEAGE